MAKNKLILAIIISIFLLPAVFASWSYDGGTQARGYLQSSSSTMVPDSITTINFTCGTANGDDQYHQPIFTPYGDDDAVPDLFISCGGDALNANPHLMVISDDLEVLDTITITTSKASGLLADYMPISMFDYDGDANRDIAVLNIQDRLISGGLTVSIIIYEFNISGEVFEQIDEQLIFNQTVNVSTDAGVQNMTQNLENNPELSGIDCFSGTPAYCVVYTDGTIFRTNMTEDYAISWFTHLTASETPVVYYEANKVLAPAYDPINGYIWHINDTGYAVGIDLDDGSRAVNASLSIFGSSEINFFSTTPCDASDCEAGYYHILVSYIDSGDAYTDLYSTQDGDFIERVWTVPDAGSADRAIGWVEDRDEDGNDELCSLALDTLSSANSQAIKCEELNFFAFDTIDDSFTIGGNEDASISNMPAIVDIDGDGDYDVVSGKSIIILNTSVTVYTFLNDTIGASLAAPVASPFYLGATGTGTIVSWLADASNTDTYYLSSSDALPEEAVGRDPVEFYYGLFQLYQNPVCANASLPFRCSYSNGCVVDDEYDDFRILLDCFNDGAQFVQTEDENDFYQTSTVECDLSEYNYTGGTMTINATAYVWDYNDADPDQSLNDSYTFTYSITNASGCHDASDPGNVTEPAVNQRPIFGIINPYSTVGEPVCLDSAIAFICPQGDCYSDPENDSVWFSIDCDDDGVYEKSTGVGQNKFICTFNESGNQFIRVRVHDLSHSTNLDSTRFAVSVSVNTSAQALAAGEIICRDPSFFDDSGQLIDDSLIDPEDEDVRRNAIYRYSRGFAEIFNMDTSTFSYLLIITVCILLFWQGAVNGVKHSGMITSVIFVALSTVFALSGCISFTLTIIVAIIAIAMLVYRVFNTSGAED